MFSAAAARMSGVPEQPDPPQPPSAPPATSCSRFLDAVYFCYSPVWQVTELYRQGQLDDCRGKWGELLDCLSLKAKPDAELQARAHSRRARCARACVLDAACVAT